MVWPHKNADHLHIENIVKWKKTDKWHTKDYPLSYKSLSHKSPISKKHEQIIHKSIINDF